MNNERNKGGNFLLGFFLGGLLGSFLIFVLGTKEGKKILKQLLEKAEVWEEELGEKTAKLQEKGEKLLEGAEKIKEKAVEDIKKGKKNLSGVLSSRVDQALTKIEDIQQKSIGLTKKVHGRYFNKKGKKIAKK